MATPIKASNNIYHILYKKMNTSTLKALSNIKGGMNTNNKVCASIPETKSQALPISHRCS